MGSADHAQLTAERPYTLKWAVPSPQKTLALSHGDLDRHLHGSLGPPEFSTQTASWSVQPFLQGLLWQTDIQSDHATRSL